MLKYILVGAGLVLFGVGATWFGLGAVAARVRATTALRARGLWTLLRAWLQPLGCTAVGIGFVLLGAAALWISYVALTIAPVHAPPIVRVSMGVALVIMHVATVLGGCGIVLWLAGGMASAMWGDARSDVMDHHAVPDAVDHNAVHYMLDTMTRQQGAEEHSQAPRRVSHRRSLFEMGSPAWFFRSFLLCILVPGIFVGIVDLAAGTFTFAVLVRLALFALGFAVVMTMFIESSWTIAKAQGLRDRARRRRTRQDSERHT